MDYDAIVIGSGFGGAVTACRLAQKGMSVLILERGRRWSPETYPRRPTDPWIFDDAKPHRRNGWIDVRRLGRMTVALGAGVGGGSLCYSAVAVEAPPEIFDEGWPAEITAAELKPHYDRVGREMSLQTVPDNQLSPRFHLAAEAARNLGHSHRFKKTGLVTNFDPEYSFDRPDPVHLQHSKAFTNAQGVKQGTCVHLGNCDIGCDARAKNSLDFNYIPAAEAAGAELRTLHVVRLVEPSTQGGWRVRFDDVRSGTPVPSEASARRVILAMGSIGSTEFLLRCRDQYRTLPQISHRLGHHWSGNANLLTFAKYPRDADIRQSTGPTIAGMLDFTDGSYRGQRFAVEDDGFPNIILAAVQGQLATRTARRLGPSWFETWQRERSFASRTMVWLGSGADAGDGRLSLGAAGRFRKRPRLQLDYALETNEAVHQAAYAMHVDMTRATGGRMFPNLLWSRFRRFISLHPLGGCGMSDTASDGVVDHTGAVHRCPGLYVVDGAMLPGPTILNPSHTIAALAERSAELMH